MVDMVIVLYFHNNHPQKEFYPIFQNIILLSLENRYLCNP